MNSEPSSSPTPQKLRNWISLAGLMVVVASWFAFLLLLTLDFFAHQENPYIGILIWIISPSFLVLGLAMMGLGRWVQARRLRKLTPGAALPRFVFDANR